MVDFNLPRPAFGEGGGILADPSITRALRILSMVMVVPGVVLAIPFTFKDPFFFRFPGMLMSIFSGLVGWYCLSKKKRSRVVVCLLDLLAGILLALFFALQMWKLEVWVKSRGSYRYRRYYSSRESNADRHAVIITCFWCLPILIQFFTHVFFFAAHAKTLFARCRSISLTTCPHCHRSTNSVFANSPAGSPPHHPSHHGLLGQAEEAYRDSFDEDAQARTTSFGDTPRASQEGKTGTGSEDAAVIV